MPSSNGNFSSEELGKGPSQEDHPKHSDFVDIGYSNTDVAMTENSGTTEDVPGQTLIEGEEGGESNTTHTDPRDHYHDGSPSHHYQDRSPGHYRSKSPSESRKVDEGGSHGEEDDQASAGYGEEARRRLDRETSPSVAASLKMKADPSDRTESSDRDEAQKLCPRCGISLPSDENMESHMNVCSSNGPPHLTREDNTFHFDSDANKHINNNNNNDNMSEELAAGDSDRPNLSHIHQLIRGLSKQQPNGMSGGSPGLNPVLDALKMKLMDPSNQNTDNKVESFENMTSLQRAYYTLQQQQMLQVQLIQKIQAQLSLANKEQIPENNNFQMPHPSQNHRDSPLSHAANDRRTPSPRNKQPSSNILSELMERFKPTPAQKPNREKTNQHPSVDPRDRPLSPSSTSGSSAPGMQNTVLQHPDPPTTAETNSLEKLQQTANHVLTKASQGIFTHHLIEDSNNTDSRDSSNKHKCRYCGKVFGSDSGLQIHLRSHTGERPFKCNICGNRFTTRGNLKVHFQRHQSRFPHVKMNHNPVPEHLDKLYPPLLAQLGELEDTPPAPTGPPNPFSPPITVPPPSPYNLSSPPPLTLQQPLAASLIYRRVLEKSESDTMNQRFLDIPVSRPDDRLNRSLTPPGDSHSKDDSYSAAAAAAAAEKHANEDLEMSESLAERQKNLMDKMYSENSMENCNSEGGSDDINMTPKCEMSDAMDDDLSNDSSGSPNSNVGDIQANRELLGMLQRRQLEFPPAAFPGMRLPFNFPFLPGLTNMAPRPGGKPGQPLEIPGGFDVTKDPNIYTNLLPRPGSTDNSWEALIEVQKTSETMKLEQLVNNIENKLTDPNQCIICHRVLSCKSALQMHYRIHTGERPYKCKICSRTFTTKGNLKTHMSVHRARPPIRMLHQCPVCHKRYNNGMILQQHIRQHTGEPTDITNEQMAAAEVRELIPTSMHQMVLPRFPPFSPHIPGLLHLMHPLRPHLFPEGMHRDQEGKEDSKEEEKDSRPFSSTLRSFAEEASENRTGSSEDGQSRLSPSRSLSPGPLDFSYSHRTQRNSEERSSRTDDKSPNRANSPPARGHGQDHPSSPLDLALRPPPPPLFSPFGLFPPPLTGNPLSPQGQHMNLSGKNRFLPAMLNIPGQGNTTCKICFKTLSCASALEIHYRSHTKDRPFICTVCDRRFTTRGNMKQHMVTHKGHEDNLPPAPPPSEKPARSRNSSRTHSPKMSVSLPPSSSHMIPSYIQAGLSSPSSSASVLQGIPLAPALFTYSQFSHPLAALPGSIAALLGQSGIHGPRTDEHKMDLLNLKREREGEIPLPMSKRLSGLGQEGEEKMSTTPPHTPPPAPDTPFTDSHPTHQRLHPSSPTPARTPTSPLPLTHPGNTPHSISELLTHPPSPDDHPCHQPSTSPHTQPLLVS